MTAGCCLLSSSPPLPEPPLLIHIHMGYVIEERILKHCLRFIYDYKYREQSTFIEFFLLMWEVSKDWHA